MKKVLAALLLAAIAMAASAQDAGFSASGSAKLTFGADVDFGERDYADTNSKWNFKAQDAQVTVNGHAGPVSASVTLEADTGNDQIAKLDGWHATVDLSPLELKVGLQWLPWVQWTGIGFNGESNWGWGASAIQDHLIQASYKTGQLSAYLGLMNEGVSGIVMNREYNSDPNEGDIGRAGGARAVFPGFFIGADFDAGLFSIGLGFAGVGRGSAWKPNWTFNDDFATETAFLTARAIKEMEDLGLSPEQIAEIIGEAGEPTATSRFAWTANLHGKVNIEPLTIGFNFAMYGDPGASAGNIRTTPGHTGAMTGNKEDFIIEAMIHASAALAPCNVDLSLAFIANATPVKAKFADNKGNGFSDLRLALASTFKLGGGFTLTPGLITTLPLTRLGTNTDGDLKAIAVTARPDENGAGSAFFRPDPSMNLGITFGWSF